MDKPEIPCRSLLEDTEYRLNLELLAGEAGLDRTLRSSRIQKPGLALAGHTKQVRPHRVQVIGATEIDYLNGLGDEKRDEAVRRIFSLDVACFVITKGISAAPVFIEEANARSIAVFRSSLRSRLLIERIEQFLEHLLAPSSHVHGVMVDVMGVGILIRGPSGVGKSECAMDLLLRGHRLVADDMVEVIRHGSFRLQARGSGLIRYHIEIRGLGVLNIQELFGITAIRPEKDLELVIDLIPWAEAGTIDRLGLEERRVTILDVEIPEVQLPVAPGRNIASVVEVAARNHLLKQTGHNAAVLLDQKLRDQLAGPES